MLQLWSVIQTSKNDNKSGILLSERIVLHLCDAAEMLLYDTQN